MEENIKFMQHLADLMGSMKMTRKEHDYYQANIQKVIIELSNKPVFDGKELDKIKEDEQIKQNKK